MRRTRQRSSWGISFAGWNCFDVGRLLIILGLVLAAIGLLITLGLPIGRLPGDFTLRRGNFSFYFPLTTSIIASILLTLLMMFLTRR